MNDLFAGELTDADLLTYARHISDKLLESDTLSKQAAHNNKEQFALGDFPSVQGFSKGDLCAFVWWM